MNNNLVRIAILQDRSASMSNLVHSVVSGINEFVRDQRKEPGDVNLKLAQFDDISYDTVFDLPLAQVPVMTNEMFQPRGNTPLLDSQARLIIELGEELAAMPEAQRPGKVIVVTITDGQENASRKYTADQVREMVRVQTEVYGWIFSYLGANQDAFAAAAQMGIKRGQTMAYAGNDLGVRNSYMSFSSNVRSVRSAVSNAAPGATMKVTLDYSDEDREKAMGGVPPVTTSPTWSTTKKTPFGRRP